MINWRKWFRVIHRDFGYLFFALTIIYSLSGIALNHLNDWNPNYVVTTMDIRIDDPGTIQKDINQEEVKSLLIPYEMDELYKNHYFPDSNILKVFLDGGTMYVDMNTGQGLIERVVRRPIFREVNYLHYNPIKYWTWFSDVFCGALIALAITGLFLVRGKKGITGRGAWLTILGVVIPIIFLILYFY